MNTLYAGPPPGQHFRLCEVTDRLFSPLIRLAPVLKCLIVNPARGLQPFRERNFLLFGQVEFEFGNADDSIFQAGTALTVSEGVAVKFVASRDPDNLSQRIVGVNAAIGHYPRWHWTRFRPVAASRTCSHS